VARLLGLISFFLCLFLAPALAVSYPQPVGYVNDFAGLYSSSFVSSLNQELKDLDQKTTVQFVVVTVANLGGDTVENYAVNLFKAWAIGQKSKDNGLLLLISKEDRKLRFEVGYGLEGQITDGTAGEIIRTDITPAFKSGNYEAGTAAGVNRIFQLLNFSASISPPPSGIPINLPFNFDMFWVYALLFVYFMSYMARTREFLAGGVVGFIVGLLFFTLGTAAVFALIGFLLDFILSRNYRANSLSGRPTDFFNTFGGFKGGGGWGGGGGGGFSGGGGSSGGGGASGSW
jgi:uncharacterized protein